MGLIRVLLATGVLTGHCGTFFGLNLLDGPTCVEAFFIISGFYMALILNEKYVQQKNAYWLFISNRFLRLFPIYWIVLLIVIFTSLIWGHYTKDYLSLAPYFTNSNIANSGLVYITITNIILLGQDTILFLTLNHETGNLTFTSNFWLTEPKLYNYLPVPQAWSISIELVFYFIAPLLLRKKAVHIFIFILGSLLLRFSFYTLTGYDNDPWSYRFFPFEIAFFLLGALSYKIFNSIKQMETKMISRFLLAFTSLYVLFFQYLPIDYSINKLLFYLIVSLSIPFIFALTKSNRLDNKLGEFSYPLYLSHLFIFTVLTKIIGVIVPYTGFIYSYLSEVTLVFTFAFSYLLIKLISEPIEKLRLRRVQLNKSDKIRLYI